MTTTKFQYGTPAAFTISLASLASSTQLLAGRQSTIVDNSTDQYLDEMVWGYVQGAAAGAPTAGSNIVLYVFAQDSDTPTYPTYDGTNRMGATDAAVTFTNVDHRGNACRVGAAAVVGAATAGLIYNFAPFSVASLFGGVMPKRWGIFVSQNSGQTLHATGGNHVIQHTPVTLQTA